MIKNTWWQQLALVQRPGLPILLYGPPGTGKTRTATGGTAPVIQCNPELADDQVSGHWGLSAAGATVWIPGPALIAARTKSPLVLDEVGRIGDVSAILPILDGRTITLISGESYSLADSPIIATSNQDPRTDNFDAALLDRFTIRIRCDVPHPDALLGLPPVVSDAASAGDITLRAARAFNTLYRAHAGKPEHVAQVMFIIWGGEAMALARAWSIVDENTWSPVLRAFM